MDYFTLLGLNILISEMCIITIISIRLLGELIELPDIRCSEEFMLRTVPGT